MDKFKRLLKVFFIKTRLLFVLDKINYRLSKFKNYQQNKRFKKLNPGFAIPPDYYLYETYALDYAQYKEDGENTALEILEWTKPYLKQPVKILEWGCGVSRIVRHIPNIASKDCKIYGVDINDEMIKWNTKNISKVKFAKNNYNPPLSFADNQFDLIFALSVFTHIEPEIQNLWIKEICRVAGVNGIFLFTTHGKMYESHLNKKAAEELKSRGSFLQAYEQKGHRMMTTYNSYENFRKNIEPYFEILEYYDGEKFPEKAGRQDLWIVKKI